MKYPGDETLVSGATRIARSNPRLQKFSLTFIPPVYPVPLPFSLPYRPFPFTFPARSTGLFEVSCDDHGLPLSLSALEYSTYIWPLGLGISDRTRKYTIDLRPASYPGRRKTGLRGFACLLVEASSAGEEIRVMMFCALLIVLAACGIVANGSGDRSSSMGATGTTVVTAQPHLGF